MMWSNSNWLQIGLSVHLFFMTVFLVGVIFFVAWAIRALSKEQLKNWAIWALAIGFIGLLVTMMLGFGGRTGVYGFEGEEWLNMHLMDEEHEELSSLDDWREHMLEEMEEHMGF